jgi:hypothetical protein
MSLRAKSAGNISALSKQYFATVQRTSATQVCVTLGDVLNEDGDPGDPTERGGRFGEQWVAPGRILEM